jgi:hypothetical protein
MNEVRAFPETRPRVESGAIQFGEDWPGTFIRGDHAAHFAAHLQSMLDGHLSPISEAVLLGLLSDLQGSRQTPGASAADKVLIIMPAKKPVCAKCGSDKVAADTAARWNVSTQQWDVCNVFDKGHGCDACGAADIDFTWVPAT